MKNLGGQRQRWLKKNRQSLNDKRELRVLRGCINDGAVDLFHFCGDENCKSCNEYAVSFDEYIKNHFEYTAAKVEESIMEYAKHNSELKGLSLEEVKKILIDKRDLNI